MIKVRPRRTRLSLSWRRQHPVAQPSEFCRGRLKPLLPPDALKEDERDKETKTKGNKSKRIRILTTKQKKIRIFLSPLLYQNKYNIL